MKKILYALVGLLLMVLFFFGLGSFSPFTKVYSEEEPGIKLSKYHTFNWLDNTTANQGNSGPEWIPAITQQKIRTALEEQLSRYGLKPCDEKPDLMLHYHIVVKSQVLYLPDWSCGGVFEAPGQYDRCHRVQAVHYREGTLIVDFIEAKDGNQVWRGAAVGVLENLRPEEADARIKAAAEAIFSKYPEKPIPNVIQ